MGLFRKSIARSLYACLLLCSISTFSSSPEYLQEQTVLIYNVGLEGGWIPYQQSAEKGKEGVFKQVMDAVGRKSGILIKNIALPPKRADRALKDGLLDFDFNVLEWMPYGDYGHEQYVLSDALFPVTEFIVTHDTNSHLFKVREDYYGKPIGTVAGYFYFDDDKFTRVDFLRENLLMQGLKRARFDAIIMEKESARYWANIHNMKIAFPVQHTEGSVRVRLRKQKRALIPKINQGIKAIKQSGELEAILLQHGIVDALPTNNSNN